MRIRDSCLMILFSREKSMSYLSKKIIITSGYYNPIHIGHINLLRSAKQLGDHLAVIVNNDDQVRLKGSVSFMPQEERVAIIQSIRYVDEVVLSSDRDTSIAESLRQIAGKYRGSKIFFAKGGDRNADNIPSQEKTVCDELNITIVNGVGGGKVQSSSWLLAKSIPQLLRK